MRRKRKIQTFRDLIVYQNTREASLEIANKVIPFLEDEVLRKKLREVSMEIPRMISEAHSKRFDRPAYSLEIMMEVMSRANEAIVLLEQVKGLELSDGNDEKKISEALIGSVIREYEMSRKKVFHLSRSWKKYYIKTTDS